jgi:hypothetical protein
VLKKDAGEDQRRKLNIKLNIKPREALKSAPLKSAPLKHKKSVFPTA